MSNYLQKAEQETQTYNNQDEDEIDLRELIGTLIENKWIITSIVVISTFIGIIFSVLSTPIYKADAMLQVEESSQPLGALEPMEGLLASNIPVAAEIEIIKSRKVLGEVVENLNTNIVAEPKFFPKIGKTIARKFELANAGLVSSPLFGFTDYAWGGERIRIETLEIPNKWLGSELTLRSGVAGSYQLFDSEGKHLIDGVVGKLYSKKLNGNLGKLQIFVSLLKARQDTLFIVKKNSKIDSINKILSHLTVVEKGKSTGILNLNMESSSPIKAMNLLNEIANIYVRLNVEQKSAEAQNTLEFLDKQLPMIKNQLEAATTALNEYRLQKGSVDLDIETQSILQSVVEKRTQITLLQQKRDELRRGFTESHPSVVAIDKQINRLESQMKKDNKKITELPETQQVILRLSRDVQVNTELYTTLLNHLQTIKVAKAGTVGDVRIIDYAVLPTDPVKPKKMLIVAVSFILGLIIGIATAFIRKALSHGVEDPDLIEKNLNVPVYATVPHSEIQKKLMDKLSKANNQFNDSAILALESNEDLAIESLRSLRTTLHFAFLEANNKIIMITGPSPGVGKTFISTNLAFVLASTGKKVLLIDADLRKGYINKTLGVRREHGLSDLISNNSSREEVITTVETEIGNIDFISTGKIPPNPSELLLHERFERLLELFDQQYEYIIIDSPPILAVTDACIIGRLASVTLMVAKANQHPMRELEQSVKRLKQNNVNIKGFIFNDVPARSSGYGYGRYIYQYNYQK